MKFTLLGNAIDSLALGLEFALVEDQDPSKLKLSVLLIAQSVELLLKERLRREHWSLIYRNIESAGSPAALTVSIDEAEKRLSRIAGVDLSQDHKVALDELTDTRNQLQHFEIHLTFEQVVAQIHAAVDFLAAFLINHLGLDLRDLVSTDVYEELIEIEEHAERLRELAIKRVKEVEDELLPTKLADLAASDYELTICPRCSEEYFTFMPSARLAVCQFCGFEDEIVQCARCSQYFPSSDWLLHQSGLDYAMCENCWGDLMAE